MEGRWLTVEEGGVGEKREEEEVRGGEEGERRQQQRLTGIVEE